MSKKERKVPKNSRWQVKLLSAAILVMAAILLPTTIVLLVGMLPTIVLLLVDKTAGRSRAITIGAMNMAGCAPFIMELWMKGHTIDMAMVYILQPRTIVVMYLAAAIGYMIEWAVVHIVSGVVVQKARGRIVEIEKQQAALCDRWGREVTGRFSMDEWGFAVDKPDNEEKGDSRDGDTDSNK